LIDAKPDDTFIGVRGDRSCGARALNATPLFSWKISYLVLILGDSSRSKHGLCLVEISVCWNYLAISERFSDENPTMPQIRDQS